jgi:hypothetical protein
LYLKINLYQVFCKSIFTWMRLCIIPALLLCFSMQAFGKQDDSLQASISKPKKIKYKSFKYFRIGTDITKWIADASLQKYFTFEIQADATFKKNLNLASELGYATSKVENEVLQFNANNIFMTLGVDKTILNKEQESDFDNAFVGVRYGLSMVNRSAANYFIKDPIWGNTSGIIPAQHFFAHWFELTGGFRLEVKKNIFAGWNIRFRTFINPDNFKQLPPAYLAGYGRADKNTSMGYNFYILYGIGKR